MTWGRTPRPVPENEHVNKRFDAIDAAVGGIKEGFEALKSAFAALRAKVEYIEHEREKHMADLTALKAAVDANTAAVSEATVAINKLAAQGVDPAVIAGFTSQLATNNSALQSAVAAVTPPLAPATPPTT